MYYKKRLNSPLGYTNCYQEMLNLQGTAEKIGYAREDMTSARKSETLTNFIDNLQECHAGKQQISQKKCFMFLVIERNLILKYNLHGRSFIRN